MHLGRIARSVAGIGEYDPFAPPPVPGSLVNPSNPCAPGLHYVNGSCFREPGPGGVPQAGPAENNQTAARILGGGAVCRAERVDVGPFVYEQNICRDPGGNIIGGADNIAEHTFVEASLRQTPGATQPPVLFTAIPESQGPAPVPPPATKPNQSTPPRDQPGTTALPPSHTAATSVTQTARETAAQQEQDLGTPLVNNSTLLMWAGAAAAGLFIFMSMSKGSR